MFYIFVNPRAKRSVVRDMYAAGVPAVASVQAKSEYCKATYDWLLANWSTNALLIPYLVGLVEDHKKTQSTHLPVRNSTEMAKGQALAKFLNEEYLHIEHLGTMFKDFKQPNVPEISTMFNNMNYFERQKYLRQGQSRVEVIPESELKPLREAPRVIPLD